MLVIYTNLVNQLVCDQMCLVCAVVLYRVYKKKTEQIGNRSQICKAAVGMKFLVQVHYFGTYDVE